MAILRRGLTTGATEGVTVAAAGSTENEPGTDLVDVEVEAVWIGAVDGVVVGVLILAASGFFCAAICLLIASSSLTVPLSPGANRNASVMSV
jgi:hypothetical protein